MSRDHPDRALLITRDWRREQATKPGADPLWEAIADEMDAYLDEPHPEPAPDSQEALI